MSYFGFVRVKKNCALDIYHWFKDNGFVASYPLPLSPFLSEIFLSDVTLDQRTFCTDYLSYVYGVFPDFYES